MGVYLNSGKEGFEEALRSKIYVDKSELIAYTNGVLRTEQKYICVSRPRRFGKSMAAKMLAAYYCRTCDSDALFSGLKIAKHESYRKHLNQYDVISVDMNDFLTGSSSIEAFLETFQRAMIQDLKEVYEGQIDFSSNRLVDVLNQIYAKTGTRFIFIIDEWDCVLRSYQKDKEAHMAYLDYLRTLLKGKNYVCLAYMTGILPIKKYGTHSALNMFTEYSMIDQLDLAEYTGFTEEEVRALCNRHQMNFEDMRYWYDGYLLYDNLHIYNPKSVVDALCYKRMKSYWTQTETYDALKIYIDMNFDGLRDDIIQMLGGGRCHINTETFTNDMTTFQTKDDVLTLLVHLGYLAYDLEQQEVFIPNEEVRKEFVNAITVSGWQEVMRSIEASKQLLEDTLSGDTEAVAEGLNQVHTESTSILAYHNENSLSCVISLAYYSARAYYTLVRELPAGKGFADIVFVPRRAYPEKPALIVELKWNQSADGAIAQMKQKNYVDALKDYTGPVLLVGINYDKASKTHQCSIEQIQK